MLREEELHQKALVEWFNFCYPSLFYNFFHIPNGGFRKKSEGARFKAMGVKSGVSDFFLAVPSQRHHGLFIEMKSKIGQLTINQVNFLKEMTTKGYATSVCRDWQEGSEVINHYLERI